MITVRVIVPSEGTSIKQLEEGATVRDALGFAPENGRARVGGTEVGLDFVLEDNDRVEWIASAKGGC